MGVGVKHLFHSLFLLLLLPVGGAQAQTPADPAAREVDLRRQLIEQQRETTVCEVRSRHLDQQIIDLQEQLAATRDALDRLVARHAPPPEPSPAEEGVATPGSPENPIEVEELPDPEPEPPPVPVEAPAQEATPGEAAAAGTSVPLTPPSAEALALYDEGYTLFHEKRYEEAVTRFERYAELHPSTELTDNALFWIGESHYAVQDFEAALEAFAATVARFPEGNKVPDALLKAGKCLQSLGEEDEAYRTFEEVVARFPSSAAAAAAAELLAAKR